MLQGLIYPVVVAALGGAAWIAYQHPLSFRRLGIAVLAITLPICVYLITFQWTADDAIAIISSAHSKPEMIAALRAKSLLRGQINFFVQLGLFALAFLMSFPLWLNKDEK